MHRHTPFHSAEHTRGGPHRRARRGAVVMAIVSLLDERPMHGYELIGELEVRSGGRWRPSSGTIYPALGKLEQRGLVTSEDIDGKQQYTLTDEGRQVAARMRNERSANDTPQPWDEQPTRQRSDLRRHVAELEGQARQIGRFGTDDQIERARLLLDSTKRSLYAILAEPPTEAADDPAGGSPSATPSTDPI